MKKYSTFNLMIIVAFLLAGCGTDQTIHANIPSQTVSTPKTMAHGTVKITPSSVAKKAGNPMCRPDPLAGVYHPSRLTVIDKCKTISGTVEDVKHEADHDYHIRLKLDAQYKNMINSQNVKVQHGDLVLEIIPMDTKRVPVVKKGEHITVTGAYVKDGKHGWMEIHPVWNINGQGSAKYTKAEADQSVQTGVCGNGDSDCHK